MDELEPYETSEEKVATQIGDLLSNFRLDLDSVGFYLARALPYEIYYRFETVAEAARKEITQIEKDLTARFGKIGVDGQTEVKDFPTKGAAGEEKVAVQIGDLLSNFRLDLDSAGIYIARTVPYEIYYRFETVAEAARKFNS